MWMSMLKAGNINPEKLAEAAEDLMKRRKKPLNAGYHARDGMKKASLKRSWQ